MTLLPPTLPPAQHEEAVRAEQLRLLFETLPFNICATLLVATIVAITFWSAGNRDAVVLWFAIMIFSSSVRAASAVGWHRDQARHQRTIFWRNFFIVASMLGGASWGVGNYLLFPDADTQQQVLLIFVATGISAAATVSLSTDRKVAWAFLLPCTVPLALQLYRHAEVIGGVASAMGVLYLVFIATVIHRLHNYVNDNVTLRIAVNERERLRDEYAQALSSSQEKLRALFELSPFGCSRSLIDGTVVEVNPAYERMLGYRADECAQLGNNIVAPAYRQTTITHWRGLTERGGSIAFECDLICRSGKIITVSIYNILVNVSDGQDFVWSIVEDITQRQRIYSQLAASREQFTAFIEYVPAAVTMLDRNLNCVACSRRWADEGGLTVEQVVGHNHYELYPWLPQHSKDVHQRCLQGAVERCDAEPYVWPDGRLVWSRWEVRPWYDLDGQIGGILILNEDITARHEAEDALHARDELLRKLAERVPGFIYQFYIKSDGTQMFNYVSEAAADLYELDPAALYANAEAIMQRIHPDDITRMVSPSPEPGTTSTRIWGVDYRVILPIKGLRWLHNDSVGEEQPDGSIIWHGYVADITERKKTEEQLLILNNRISLATQAGGIGVWEWDLISDELLWDERMYEIYGVPHSDAPLLLEGVNALVHPDDWQPIIENFVKVKDNPQQERYIAEYRIIRSDDTERTIRTASIFQRDAAGMAQKVIGVTWDVTDARKVERMKSEFVSTVSHELRTPLTSIRGSLGLLASGIVGELPASAQELIDAAYKNSERLSLLINDILDIEKIESGKMHIDLQRQSLQPLIEQGVLANQGYAQTFAVKLVLHECANVEVEVDTNRLMQVMANLISNAVKFSPAGGVVDIAMLLVDTRVRVEVRDRGPGIPANFRERIFQRFSQADASDTRARGGSGLGLAITKTLLEKMHGDIGFEKRSGGGTVFFFELPRAAVLN